MRKLPQNITFQWHITNKCNFRCKHCYQDDYIDNGVGFSEQLSFLTQIIKFLNLCKKENSEVFPKINITGGEPFLREDLFQLPEEIDKNNIPFSILSNGFLPSEENLKKLKKLKPKFIQISLEGGKKINDEIRGDGAFDQITSSFKVYKKLKIPVMISFTENPSNYKDFPEAVKIARKFQVMKIWTDCYLPFSRDDKMALSARQSREFFEIIKR